MAMLEKIEIKGYRSIKAASVELRKLNVLIGANGAGKSNFISFFKLLNEMMAGRLQEYIGKTGRAQSILHFGPKVTPQLEAILEFDEDGVQNWYGLRFFHASGDTLGFADETLRFLKPGYSYSKDISLGSGHHEAKICDEADRGDPTARFFRHLLNQCRVYHFHDTSATAPSRQASYLNDNHRLLPNAGNLASMLYVYQQQHEVVYKRIVSAVRKIMPDFGDFDLAPSRLNPNEIFLNWRKKGSDYLFGPHQISDGTLRVMAILTLLLQPEDDLPDVIILDEPELGLHPHALEIVAGLLRAVSEKTQVIVATQSLTFLNYFEPSEIITVDCHNGQSQFHRLESEPLKDWLEDYSIGELWQRNVIGAGPMP